MPCSKMKLQNVFKRWPNYLVVETTTRNRTHKFWKAKFVSTDAVVLKKYSLLSRPYVCEICKFYISLSAPTYLPSHIHMLLTSNYTGKHSKSAKRCKILNIILQCLIDVAYKFNMLHHSMHSLSLFAMQPVLL